MMMSIKNDKCKFVQFTEQYSEITSIFHFLLSNQKIFFFFCSFQQSESKNKNKKIDSIRHIIKKLQIQNIQNKIRLMLHPQTICEKDVERSISRLKEFTVKKNPVTAIPAFYYSAELLMKYAKQHGVANVDYKYFQQFNEELLNFTRQDLTDMKQHEREIIDEVVDITGSEIFVECLKSEMRTSRMRYLQDEESSTGSISNDQVKFGLAQSLVKSPSFQEANRGTQLKAQQEEELKASQKQSSQQLFDKLLKDYKEHNIDGAYELKNKYLANNYPLEDSQQNLFDTIDLQYNTMINFHNQFDQDGWIFDKVEKGVSLQYKLFEEEKQIAIRIQSEFDVKVQNFLAILCQMDLFGNYVPFCYDSKECKVISRNQKIGTSKIYIPCLTDRETYFYAAGYDRYQKNGSIFLFSKTINTDTLYQEKYGFKVPDESNYIRLEYKFFIVEYIPLTKTRAKVRLASKVDMKLNFLPQFILNMSARKFAFDYFKNIIKVNKKFKGSEWEKKMKENPDFYQFFQQKIDGYLSQKGQ